MNTNPNESNNGFNDGRLDEVLLTAYALGQLDESEQATVEAVLAGSLEARQAVDQIRALAGHVQEAARQGPTPRPSPALRQTVENRLKQVEESQMERKPQPSSAVKSRGSRRRLTLLRVAACLAITAIPVGLVVSNYFHGTGRDVAFNWAAEKQTQPPETAAMRVGESAAASDEDVTARRGAGQRFLVTEEAVAARVQPRREGLAVTSTPQETVRTSGKEIRAQETIVVNRSNSMERAQSTTVGTQPPGVFSADLDIPFTEPQIATSMRQSGGGSGGRPGYVSQGNAPATAPARDVAGVRLERLGELSVEAIGQPVVSGRVNETKAPVSAGQAPAGGYTVELNKSPYVKGQADSSQLGVTTSRGYGARKSVWEMRSAGEGEEESRRRVGKRLMGDHLMLAERAEAFGTEQYDPIVENEFLFAREHAESTFSVDVDTASYANVRRFLDAGRWPPPDAVRIEEMVNYFRYDYPLPEGEVPFSVDIETAQCPWSPGHRLVRIGLKGQEIDVTERGPGNLVFLLDVSGSMRDANKLPLVKQAMTMLVDQLTEDDRVAIVTYANSAGLVLESTCGDKRRKILRHIDSLSAGGSTHGSAGIVLAYDQAMRHFVADGTNRVILCTDGDLNVGITDDDELVQLIQAQAKSGVFLTVLGFGTGNLKDSKLEKLADRGNGSYAYVDSLREARRVFIEQVSGSLVTIAKDVKIQIEFNPAEVDRYRLIGYENRVLAAEDFDNDKKDAGEIGAGHTVTALYEIIPTGRTGEDDEGKTDLAYAKDRKLKYQRHGESKLTEAAASGELLTLKLRYKLPEGKKSKLLELVAKDSDKRFGRASADFRFASAVAAFGMLLRGSQHAGDLTLSAAEEFAAGAIGDDPGGYRAEFVDLVRRAGGLRSRPSHRW